MAVIEIPADQLQPETLRSLIEEFVTRHGAVQGQETDLETRIDQVRRQLAKGKVVIVFDDLEEACNILTQEEYRRALQQQQESDERRIDPAE